MALIGESKLYSQWKNKLLKGHALAKLDTTEGVDGVYVALIDVDVYTQDDTQEFYSELTGVVASDVEILNKTQVNAIFDGDDITFTNVTGPTIEAIVIYRKNAGASNTWPLIAYLEQGSVTNLPLTPNGGDAKVIFHPLGIFGL